MNSYSFPKAEHLCSTKDIGILFRSGSRLTAYPFSLVWRPVCGQPVPVQVLIVAPKRKLRHAVDRNRAKRLMRELYRHSKPRLLAALGHRQLQLSLTYTHTKVWSLQRLQPRFDQLLDQLLISLNATTPAPQPLLPEADSSTPTLL